MAAGSLIGLTILTSLIPPPQKKKKFKKTQAPLTSDWSDLGSSSQSPKASAGLHLSCHIGESKLLSRCEVHAGATKKVYLCTQNISKGQIL